MTQDLDAQGRRLLELLVKKLKDVIPGDPTTYISYQDCHKELNLEMRGPTWGESLQHQGLNSLANLTKRESKPAISGIIVTRETFMPEDAYFNFFGKVPTDFEWWKEQVLQSKQFDWSPYL